MKIAIIGAGAAGCFCAVNLQRMNTKAEVHVFESGKKALAKVAITGGGRCNLTNTFNCVTNLKDVYPRGDKLMRRMLNEFSHEDCWRWFENEGVRLVAQTDECVFPQSQDAMQIVETLLRDIPKPTRKEGAGLHVCCPVRELSKSGERFVLTFADGSEEVFDKVVVTTGGHPTMRGFSMLAPLDLDIKQPVPSLFTFNIAGDFRSELMGTVVEDACASIAATKFKAHGPLLFTHWGMSGPAILKLSSHAARFLAENKYKAQLVVNWFGEKKEDEVRTELMTMSRQNEHKLVTNEYPRFLTSRHWLYLLSKSGVPHTQRWGALNKKHINKLITTLTADVYQITGKCAFKEEFVTCGGVSLNEINIKTMESKQHPGLFFAGEVLDVDAVTGGFNLQAAWSMGYVVAKAIAAGVSFI